MALDAFTWSGYDYTSGPVTGQNEAQVLRQAQKHAGNISGNVLEGYNALWDETVCIQKARQGDETAFVALYEHYEKPIYAYIYRVMGNPDDAFDLTQEVFIKAYKALSKTTPELNLSAWLHRIASNTCLDVLRRRKIVRWLPWDPAEHSNLTPTRDEDEPEYNLVQHETRRQVQQVLNKMSEKYRLSLVLREYQGLSCEEIASVLGISNAAVKSLLFRSREQFREIYSELEQRGWQSDPPSTRPKTKSRKGGNH